MNLTEARKILGLNGSEEEADIKKAYRKLAQKYHPDKCGDAAGEQFKKIKQAYDFVCSIKPSGNDKSSSYSYHSDKYGKSSSYSYHSDKYGNIWDNKEEFDEYGEYDLYDELATHVLTVKEAFFGCTKKVPIYSAHREDVTVEFPAGCTDNDLIIQSDTKIFIDVRSKGIKVDWVSLDVTIERSINIATMLAGGYLEVEMFDGPKNVYIPPGTNANSVFRIRGDGFKSRKLSKRGNLLIKLLPDFDIKNASKSEINNLQRLLADITEKDKNENTFTAA